MLAAPSSDNLEMSPLRHARKKETAVRTNLENLLVVSIIIINYIPFGSNSLA